MPRQHFCIPLWLLVPASTSILFLFAFEISQEFPVQPRWPPAIPAQHPEHQDGLFLCFEEAVLEDQAAFMGLCPPGQTPSRFYLPVPWMSRSPHAWSLKWFILLAFPTSLRFLNNQLMMPQPNNPKQLLLTREQQVQHSPSSSQLVQHQHQKVVPHACHNFKCLFHHAALPAEVGRITVLLKGFSLVSEKWARSLITSLMQLLTAQYSCCNFISRGTTMVNTLQDHSWNPYHVNAVTTSNFERSVQKKPPTASHMEGSWSSLYSVGVEATQHRINAWSCSLIASVGLQVSNTGWLQDLLRRGITWPTWMTKVPKSASLPTVQRARPGEE